MAPVIPPDPFVFSHQGLTGSVVTRLYEQQGKLLALTDKGLYQQQLNSWQLLGLKNYALFDVLIDASRNNWLHSAGWDKNFDDP